MSARAVTTVPFSGIGLDTSTEHTTATHPAATTVEPCTRSCGASMGCGASSSAVARYGVGDVDSEDCAHEDSEYELDEAMRTRHRHPGIPPQPPLRASTEPEPRALKRKKRYARMEGMEEQERRCAATIQRAWRRWNKRRWDTWKRRRADMALTAGTRLRVYPHGEGVYERFERNRFGVNNHYIRFDTGGTQKVALKKLRPQEWAVLAMAAEHAQKLLTTRRAVTQWTFGWAADTEGRNLYVAACNNDMSTLDKEIAKRTAYSWKLHVAAYHNDLSTLDQELAKGAAIEGRLNYYLTPWKNTTPMTLACRTGSLHAMEKLYECGAELDVRDDLQRTPLMHAAWNGHTEVCVWLLALGADPSLINTRGKTALDLAREHHEAACVSLLQPVTPIAEIDAATAIQKCFRGYQIRKHLLHIIRARCYYETLHRWAANDIKDSNL